MTYKKIILLILDGCGVGAQPDYPQYQKAATNTLGNIYKQKPGLRLPFLESIGLGQLLNQSGEVLPLAAYGKMKQRSAGNDTFAGVWEMFGVSFKRRFNSNVSRLTNDQLDRIRNRGLTTIGNVYLSGYKALDRFYKEHVRTKCPILYLSDDGVVLLAAHKDVLPVEELDKCAEIVAEALLNQGFVRIITRPFYGSPKNFIRDEGLRKDYLMVDLPDKNLIESLVKVGTKIRMTQHLHRILNHPTGVSIVGGKYGGNNELLPLISEDTNQAFDLLLYVVPDTDNLGHKKNLQGFVDALTGIDTWLRQYSANLNKDTLLIVTADHGCDPTADLRGHCREYVPLLLYSKGGLRIRELGTRKTFADIGCSIAKNFGLDANITGNSFL